MQRATYYWIFLDYRRRLFCLEGERHWALFTWKIPLIIGFITFLANQFLKCCVVFFYDCSIHTLNLIIGSPYRELVSNTVKDGFKVSFTFSDFLFHFSLVT